MKTHFFIKLIAPRPTFVQDMTDEERTTMQQHAAYWADLMRQGHVHVFGPVMDPSGPYGMGVASAEDDQQVRVFTSQDPAAGLMRVEVYPMRAILPSAKE